LRYDKLIPAWITHLLGNACGLLMQTRLIGIDAQPTLQALAPDEAADMLDQLLAALHAGMQSPLPIARKTAFAWLLASTDEKKDAATVAARRFEGDDYGRAGERGEDACLARAWSSFAEMHAHGFDTWLGPYRALFDNVILAPGDAA
jgi:exodeoxyribonuclease V gamma subunit